MVKAQSHARIAPVEDNHSDRSDEHMTMIKSSTEMVLKSPGNEILN